MGGAFAVLLSIFDAAPTGASNIKGTYTATSSTAADQRGYHWYARDTCGFDPTCSNWPELWVTSTHCKAAERTAFGRVQDSTQGYPQFELRWENGLNMIQVACDSKVNNNIDIDIEYSNFCTTHGCATHGGENHRKVAEKEEYCDYWMVPYPCGVHPSTVHINHPKWKDRSRLWRERLIMHETGHSQGFGHRCNADSIMNTGFSSCNGGRWTEVMVYKPHDRNMFSDVYPNWPYP